MKHMMTILAAALVAACLAGPAPADTFTFQKTNDVWDLSSNWLDQFGQNGVPDSDDTAIIPNGKTWFARRSIPLTEQAREVLLRRKGEARNGWLFPHRTDPERHMIICRSFLSVTRSLGLDFRLYDLRHTFGSRAVMAGVDLPTLKELMGHSSITMTMRYVHPTPQHKKEALRKVEKFQGTPKIAPSLEMLLKRVPVSN